MSTHYMYTGEVDAKLLRHGKGEYRYPNNIFRFTGEWTKGVKNGQGVFDAGRSTFEGSFVDGEIEGRGVKRWEDGRRYEGSFQRGEASGEGHFTSPSGESYVGTWAQNRRHGQGKLVLPSGQGSYTGEFQRHRYHGDGQLLLAGGFQYSGQFLDGSPHGLGAVVYPGGSTFKGPFKAGEKSGLGGKYVCGVTGICWAGEWAAGRAKGLPSRWAISPDERGRGFVVEGDVGRAAIPKPNAKAEKDGGGKKGGKAAKKAVVEPEVDEAVTPVVAHFNEERAVAGLWCRCVRDVQGITRLPPVPPEHKQDVEEATALEKPHEDDIVSEESGRTLAVTLHEVAEAPPGSIGPPVPFFVRRPDLTDASESLGRFPAKGLTAHFQRDERCFPKATASGGEEKFMLVTGENPAATPPVEEAQPEPPTKGKKAPAGKVKGASKGDSEQPGAPGEGGGVGARWKSIMGEVQSNRCLVLGAGEKLSLATAPLFLSEPGEAREEGGESAKASALGDDVNARTLESGGLVPKQDSTEEEGVPGVVCDGANSTAFLQEEARGANNRKVSRSTMIHSSSPFALCLDFRLELAEALLMDKESKQQEATGGSSDATGGVERRSAEDKVVRLMACGNGVEVSAVVRLWTPAITRTTSSGAFDGGANGEQSSERSGCAAAGEVAEGGGVPSAGSTLPKDTAAEKVDLDGGGSTVPLSPRDDGGCADDSSTWYLHSILVRSGSSVLTAPCVDPGEKVARVRDFAGAEASLIPGRSEPSLRLGSRVFCDLAQWHSLAVVADPGRSEAFLHLDGDEVALQRDHDGISANADGTSREESELLAGGAVVIGGAGGEWATLALKNLAVYNENLSGEQLCAITRVFRAWREEQEAAKATDAQEEERWVQEARKAVEEGREPEERPEWVVEADSETAFRRETVRGEALIDRIVLPKKVLEGGEWVLRIEDVSHEEEEHGGGSTGRIRHLASSTSLGSASASVATVTSATDEERQAFPPLPGESVKLVRRVG
ncbi:unnamed protein product [Scytosiphon promiscuus]